LRLEPITMSGHESVSELLRLSRPDRRESRPDRQEENLRRLLRAALPPAEVSDALRRRVLALEAAPPARPLRLPRLFPGRPAHSPAATAVGIACVLYLAFVRPTWVAAQTLRRLEAAIQDARSMHEVAWRVNQDGSRTRLGETWYQDGKWRVESEQLDRTLVF